MAKSADSTIAQFRHVNIMIWTRAVTIEGLRAAHKSHAELARRYPKVAALNVSGSHMLTEFPNQVVRNEAARMGREHSSSQLCSASVLEGNGFWVSAARGVVTAISVLTRPTFPMRVFAHVDEATQWIASESKQPDAFSAELSAAVAKLR